MPTSGAEPTEPIILDTSAYSRLRVGHAGVLSLLAHAPLIYVPVIVIGELEAGFSSGRRQEENQKALGEFLDEPFVHTIDVDGTTARRYGALVGALRSADTPVPGNDVWIAAVAMGTGGQLVTFDSDCSHVPGPRYQLMR